MHEKKQKRYKWKAGGGEKGEGSRQARGVYHGTSYCTLQVAQVFNKNEMGTAGVLTVGLTSWKTMPDRTRQSAASTSPANIGTDASWLIDPKLHHNHTHCRTKQAGGVFWSVVLCAAPRRFSLLRPSRNLFKHARTGLDRDV